MGTSWRATVLGKEVGGERPVPWAKPGEYYDGDCMRTTTDGQVLSHLEGSRQFTWRAELDFVHSVLCTVLRTTRTIVTEAQGSALEPGKSVTKERRKYGTKNKNQNAKSGNFSGTN